MNTYILNTPRISSIFTLLTIANMDIYNKIYNVILNAVKVVCVST